MKHHNRPHSVQKPLSFQLKCKKTLKTSRCTRIICINIESEVAFEHIALKWLCKNINFYLSSTSFRAKATLLSILMKVILELDDFVEMYRLTSHTYMRPLFINQSIYEWCDLLKHSKIGWCGDILCKWSTPNMIHINQLSYLILPIKHTIQISN